MKTPRSLSIITATRIARRTVFAAAVIAPLLALNAGAGTNTMAIGLKFAADQANSTINPFDLAGLPAVAQLNWNSLGGAAGTNTTISADSNGVAIATAVAVAWSCPNTWASGGNSGQFLVGGSPDRALMTGYLDTGNATTTLISISNLPPDFTAAGYDVYIYALGDTGGRGGSYNIVDGFNTNTVLRPFVPYKEDAFATNYVQHPGTSLAQIGNYLVFHGLSNSAITIQATTTVNPQSGTPRAPVNGIQIVQAPTPGEPGSASAVTAATNGLSGQLLVAWTPGSGSSGSLVVMRQGLPATAQPVDGVTYSGDAAFGAGANLGDDETGNGNYAVYAGSGSSVTVSNLTPTLNYNVAVYPFSGSGADINYRLASPATTNATASGVPTNILMSVPSPVVIGGARHFAIQALYDNGTRSDLAGIAAVTSSNNAIVSIQAAGRLAANAIGTIGLKAIYQGFTNIQFVTVISNSLTHRYSFGDDSISLVATDSVGTATAVITNDAFFNNDGLIHLGGTAGHVILPPDLITNYGGVTFETWCTDIGSGSWARIFDFGNDTLHNIFLTPQSGDGLNTRFAITTNGGGAAEQRLNMIGRIALNTPAHVVVTINGATRVGRLYVNGVLLATNGAVSLTPEDIGRTANNYLARSQYADPYFSGTIDEFRLYDGAVDAFQIALNAATGPDVITNNPGTLTSLQLTAGSPIQQFQTEPLTLIGNFANLANPVSLTTANGTTYTTSDPNIATVDNFGVLNANGPGVATIRGIFGGTTSTVFVTVTPVPPGITHRYSFNNDFNDSVGTAHGTARGNAGVGGGQLLLDGSGGNSGATTATYLELPPNLLLGYSSVAIELWYTDTDTGNANGWARIFDFGAGTASYMFLTPLVGHNIPAFPYIMRTAFLLAGQSGGEEQLNIPRPSLNAEHHVVWVIDASTLKGRLYVDGVLGIERNGVRQPRDMGPTPNDWLGRSQFGGDLLFIGSINEFRVYNGILTPQQVQINYLAGPDSITDGGAVSAVTMLVTNMPAQSVQQALLVANYAFTNVPVPVMSGYSNWASSDVTVAQVNEDGLITSIKAGVSTVSASFNGTVVSSNLTVSAAAPGLLHRYSFNTDASDSVGSAHGTNGGTAQFTGGRLVLDGGTNSYVWLPGHLFDGASEATFESWITVSNTGIGNTRVWDFGDSATTNYLFFTPASLGNIVTRWNFDVNPGNGAVPVQNRAEITLVRSFNGLNNGSNLVHYVWVFSDVRGAADVYINGVFQDTYPYTWLPQPPTLSRLIHTETYLGRPTMTNPVVALPANNYQGAIDEFRIWNGALNKLQIETSFASGPNNAAISPGAPSSLTLTLNDGTMVIGAIQRPTVAGTFSVGTLDLTAVPGVVYTSSDSTKVKVIGGGDARLQAVAAGSATIVASYGGSSATGQVTVIAAPALRVAHRYSFRGNAADSVGHADGTLRGQAVFQTNAVVINGVNNPVTHVQLPSDLISGYSKITIEGWARTGGNTGGSQQRFWDIGNRFNGAGFNYWYYTPGNVGRVGIPGQQGEFQLNSGAIANNAYFHVVVTVDSATGTELVYTNGVFAAGATNRQVNLSLLNDVYTQLGRSQFGDPPLNGAIDEFRIYNGVMTPAQVSASYQAGADPEKLSVALGAGTATISWPAVPVLENYALQYTTSITPPAVWIPAGAPTLIGGSNYVTVGVNTNAASFFRLVK